VTPGNGFFRSRWVEAPAHVRELEPAALPAGFRAGAVAAGLKQPQGLDVGVLFSDQTETTSAARFTSSSRLGAPVIVSKDAALDRLRAVVANAGGSNTGDGERGIDTARAAQLAAAEALGVEPEQVGLASTGVIAAELPRDKLVAGTKAAITALGDSADGLAQAIMTTDRWPKRACLEVKLNGGSVRLAGQAKGAGMISPRHATMFCFVETDAALPAETVELLTGVCVKRSFDRISVDGQLSTSDTVFVLANGASGVRVAPESHDELLLGEAIDALMRQLAMEIVADGEGAKRVGRIVVRGDIDHVEPVARSVANSPLVKTALHGADPNFGRILQAAGQVLPPPFVVDLDIEGRRVVTAGEGDPLSAEEIKALEQAVTGDEVEFELTIPGEGGETEVFFSDLSHEYVTINAEYTT
jgi:glutamate N-acetyltransferase / amino-acid N-acetyltransferase